MYLYIHLRDCMSTVPWSLKDNVRFMMFFLLSTVFLSGPEHLRHAGLHLRQKLGRSCKFS